jgi:DNA mismatch repair ATPase MutS
LIRDTRLRNSIRHQLKDVYDLQRLLARIATGRTNPRDLNQVGRTLRKLPEMKTLLSDTRIHDGLGDLGTIDRSVFMPSANNCKMR